VKNLFHSCIPIDKRHARFYITLAE
jgi:hypothetical protein